MRFSMYSDKIEINEEKSSITFETVLSNFSADLKFREQLSEANILIIPHKMRREGKNIFPNKTVELFRYLQNNSPDQVKIDIATKDEEYLDLAQHCALIEIATIIAYEAVASILLSLIASYIYDRIRPNGSRVVSEIIIVSKDGSSTSIKYNGPATEYYNTVSGILKIKQKTDEDKHENSNN